MRLDELNTLHLELLELRKIKDEQKLVLATTDRKIDEIESKIIIGMESNELKSYKNKYGQLTISQRFSVKLPQSPEAWEIFWSYLSENGIEEALKTVNHMKLNSWYREEMENAKARGDIDWHPPGLEQPGFQPILSVRS